MKYFGVFVLLLATRLLVAEPKVHRDLPDSEPTNERQTLDIYAPTESKVWIHGGGWKTGDKESVKDKPQIFVDIATAAGRPDRLLPRRASANKTLTRPKPDKEVPQSTVLAVCRRCVRDCKSMKKATLQQMQDGKVSGGGGNRMRRPIAPTDNCITT